MKNILYIGNNLSSKTTNTSSIQGLGKLFQKEGYKVLFSSSKENKVLRFFDMIWSCLKNARQTDIVLIDTYSTQNFYFALMVSQLCRILKLDYIPILHGGNLPKRLKTDPKLCHAIFNHSKCNVSPSHYLKAVFEDYGYTNTRFIPNAVEIENYPVSDKKFDTPRIFWLRSFSKIYNPKLAVLVLNHLIQNYNNAELCMVGPDSDGSRQAVEDLSKELGLDVKFTGKLDKEEWIKLSQHYNIFINTSNFDNMPVSVVEAMALRFPIVSTNVGGMPFLIENEVHGLLVDPEDAVAMSEAIETIMKNNDKRKNLMNNARQLSETFDWSIVKTKWQDIFSE